MVKKAGAVAAGQEDQFWKGHFTDSLTSHGKKKKWTGLLDWNKVKPKVKRESYIENLPELEVSHFFLTCIGHNIART